MPKIFTDADVIADDIIRDVGSTLVVGLPLGLGKANHIINALYQRALTGSQPDQAESLHRDMQRARQLFAACAARRDLELAEAWLQR